MNLNGKRVALDQLQTELIAAGINVSALGISDDALHTYDEDGAPVDVPAQVAAVLAAHVAPDPPEPADYGGDANTTHQVAAAVTQLRDYLALASPTASQTVGALKLTIRGLLFLMRRALP